jgi:hypothetical protein
MVRIIEGVAKKAMKADKIITCAWQRKDWIKSLNPYPS